MKKNHFCNILVLILIIVTMTVTAGTAIAATYNGTAIDGDSYTLNIGDTLELYNPDSNSGMQFSDYYWGIDTELSTNSAAVTVTDNNRYGIITAINPGTAVVYSELFGSYPITNYGSRYNSVTKRWETYTYITYESRKFVRRIVIKVNSNEPPTVDSLPDKVTVAKNNQATVTVTASTNTGTTLSYQWYVKNKSSSKFTKSSLTNKTYTVKMTEKADGRKIYCIITDGNGKSTKSETVTLSMADSIKIKTQPKSKSFVAGSKATATVTASGEGKLKYQWYVKNSGGSKFYKSSNTSTTYSVKMTPSVNGRKIYCVITDSYGQKTQTKTVTLKMKNQLAIYSQPTDDKAVMGDNISATVKAVGKGSLSYQWYVKNSKASKYSKSSKKSATYSVKMTSQVNGRKAYCVITDSTGAKIKSNIVTFTSVSA